MSRFYAGLLSLGCIVAATTVTAAPIRLTHTGQGSGTLNGAPFPLQNFVITAFADTNDRFTPDDQVPRIPHRTAHIAFESLGTFLFQIRTLTFMNSLNRLVGFNAPEPQGHDLFNGPSDFDWDMQSSVGPISGNGYLIQWEYAPVHTSGGILFFTYRPEVAATFRAEIIPEPATLLLAVASVGLLFCRR